MRNKVTVFIFFACMLISQNVFALLDPDIALDKIVISASRIAQHDYKIASNVSVISQEEIESSNAQNVIEVIQRELGIHTYDNSTAKTSVIDIRGFGDTATRNILVLVNDRKINSIDITAGS